MEGNIGNYLGKRTRDRWARSIYIDNLKNILRAEQNGGGLPGIRREFNSRGPVTPERIAAAQREHARLNALDKRVGKGIRTRKVSNG